MLFFESETIELKEIVTESIKKEIIAFANCAGGTIYIGVQDNGTICGIEQADNALLQITNMVRDSIKPDVSMFIHYNITEFEGKHILIIEVQRGTNRPYYLASKGLRPEGVYVRQGTSSVPATDSAIRQMIKETDGDSFECMRSTEQILTFFETEKEFEKRGIPFGIMQKQTLKILNEDSIYTNLGLLLSDQCLHTVKVAVFEGTDQSVFKDRREFTGSLMQQLNETYEYIDMHNPTQATFEKLLRIDTRSYPEIAVREALLNSFVHRDYSYRASTLVSIYTDRIEFVSVGGLMPGISLDDIMMGLSVCRNMHLANVFYRLQFIEAYGTGMQKIKKAYQNSKKAPLIEISDNAFKIILPNINSNQPGKDAEDVEQIILEFIHKNGIVTRTDVETQFDVSASTATRILKRMTEKGLLKRKGNARGTKYVLP